MDPFNDSLNVSCLSFDLGVTSTPRSSTRRVQTAQDTPSTFTAPAPVGARKRTAASFLYNCERCKKGYKTVRGYSDHLRLHKIQDAASAVPDFKEIKSKTEELAIKCLKEMAVLKPSVDVNQDCELLSFIFFVERNVESKEFKQFCDIFIQELESFLSKTKICLPSSFYSSGLLHYEGILTNDKLLKRMSEYLFGMASNFSSHVIHAFIPEFVSYFYEEVYSMIFEKMRQSSAEAAPTVETVDVSQTQRQVIHYVAGSVLKGICRMGRRYPNNLVYQRMISAIRDNMLEALDFTCASTDKFWTERLSRGALTFVNGQILEFFVGVFKAVCACEKVDGTVLHDEVLEKVMVSPVRLIWDNVVSSSLSEEESLSLMAKVVQSFAQTSGKGIVKRRLNAIAGNRPQVSMNLRHAVAPR